MKIVVVLLGLLAALKVGTREYLYRTSTGDVIVAAYRERAVDACQREPKALALGVAAKAWSEPAATRVVIGRGGLAVQPWQVDHALWNQRYRNPYLYLTAPARSGRASCEYDIMSDIATVQRM